MDKKLEDYLRNIGIDFVEYKHKSVFSVVESRKLKKEIPGLHCKTLFLKDNLERYYLLGMPAEKKLESKNFRKIARVKKIRFGSVEELAEETELIPGSVSIFGILNSIWRGKKVVLVLDKEVWEVAKVGFHPNKNTSTLVLNHENLKKFYDSLDCEKYVWEI